VRLEGTEKGNGPMLICSESFYEHLSEESREYVEKVRDHYEILWPAFRYGEEVCDSSEFRHAERFEELFQPAVDWWRQYGNTEYASHYENLLRLIIRGTL